MTDVRRVPLPASWNARGGTCRWCDRPILHVNGTVLTRRRWHAVCVADYNFCRAPWDSHVVDKTAGRCAGCDRALRCFNHNPEVIDPAAPRAKAYELAAVLNQHVPRSYQARYADYSAQRAAWAIVGGPYSPVTRQELHVQNFARVVGDERAPWGWLQPDGWYCEVTAGWVKCEIDHIFPLWRVSPKLPWAARIEYWRLGNLQALCVPCHKAKTSREAADRARLRRNKGQLALPELA